MSWTVWNNAFVQFDVFRYRRDTIKEISDNLFKEIINDASNSEYIFVERDIYFRGVTFDEVIDYIDFGLLNGVSGIVITLMAQRTGNAYPLDRMLFMQ